MATWAVFEEREERRRKRGSSVLLGSAEGAVGALGPVALVLVRVRLAPRLARRS